MPASLATADPRQTPKEKGSPLTRLFERFSKIATIATGKPAAFMIAGAAIVVWGVCGPIFHYSDTWQLVINTSTTIVTFLMVFLIQQSQNKDTVALHLKLNELIAAQKTASNRLINIEDLSDEELKTIKAFYIHLSTLAEQEGDLFTTHSLDEAQENHDVKARKVDERQQTRSAQKH